MPSKRAIIETLNRAELLELVTYFDVPAADRRVKANLVKALVGARKVALPAILEKLSLVSLKALCQKHGIEGGGRSKAPLIERLGQEKMPSSTPSSPSSPVRSLKKAPRKSPAAGAETLSQAASAPQTKVSSKKAPPAPQAKASKASQAKASQAKASQAKASQAKASKGAFKPRMTAKKPAELPPSAPRYEAMAAGQSREVSIQACQACGQSIEFRKCQVQDCTNRLIDVSYGRICAECLFERNTLSMTDFNQRLQAEHTCPNCGQPWQDSVPIPTA